MLAIVVYLPGCEQREFRSIVNRSARVRRAQRLFDVPDSRAHARR